MTFYYRWIPRLFVADLVLFILSHIIGDKLILMMGMTFVSVMLITFIIVAIQRFIK